MPEDTIGMSAGLDRGEASKSRHPQWLVPQINQDWIVGKWPYLTAGVALISYYYYCYWI